MNQTKLIHQLADSKKVLDACVRTAGQVSQAAQQIDPDAELSVEQSMLSVNGLPRVVAILRNTAEDATKKEWGGAKQQAWRPLGRAAQKFKG